MIYTKKFIRYRNIVYSMFIMVILFISMASVVAKRNEINSIQEKHAPFEKQYPGTKSISLDNTYDYFINFCGVDKSEWSHFDSKFLKEVGDAFCHQE